MYVRPYFVKTRVDALSSMISTIVAQAVQSALSHNNMPTTLPSGRSTEQDAAVECAVEREISAIATSSAGTEGLQPTIENSDPKPKQVFNSLAVTLTSRVSAKLKAKIWASEYVDFGSLLFSSPQNEGKYSLSMTPSGLSHHPHVTLEPCTSPKRIHNIQQWVSAFNIFVSVYTERFKDETPQLMKYCEVVQDLALKPGDWLWYDEQFQYITQSDPQKFPWDQIHWELWLRASTTFHRQQPFTNQPHPQPRQRFCSFFPKGTCWAFQAGKHCSGCQFEHVCYKCGAKHAGSQCYVQTRFGGVANKGKGSTTYVAGTSQPTDNPGKGRSA